MRTIVSTIVGEGVDTIIFVIIAFYGIFPSNLLLNTILSAYLFKVIYEIVATPLTYLIVGYLKRVEGVDVYDQDTNFNPFYLAIVPNGKGQRIKNC